MPRLTTALVLMATAILSSSIRADTMVLNNASFSTLPGTGLNYSSSKGSWSEAAIPGWTESGSGLMGQWQPIGQFNYLPDGSTVAYSTDGIISQQVGTVQAGMNYTLNVMIGSRLDGYSSNDATAALLIDGVTYYATGVRPTLGNWSTFTVTYSALASDVNHVIALELIEAGNGGQGDFADVQLSDAVPEPSTASFLGIGLTLLFATRLAIRSRMRTV